MPETLPAHQFETLEQQREAATLGMWVFLATEVLFFGGLFMAYTYARFSYPEVVEQASHHLNAMIGGINTAVLLLSSLMMALAVKAAQLGKRKPLVTFLALTALLGLVFLGLKAIEYHEDYVDHIVPGISAFRFPGTASRQAELFFWIYFAMTGLHAIHVTAGILIITLMAVLAHRGSFSTEHYMPIEVTGLYWHFVDIVWVFLFPLLYLAGHR
jgi:cytochrome c oxidase subunit 3